MKNEELKSLAYNAYNKVDTLIKEDIIKAIAWAREQFDNNEGALKNKEYIMDIISGFDDMMICLIYTEDDSFLHYGQRRDSGAQAIVLAVCEYKLGYNNPQLPY